MGEQAAAVAIGIERHQPHVGALHVGNAVEPRQRAVEEGLPGDEQVGGGAVLTKQVGEEELGLPPHRQPYPWAENPRGGEGVAGRETVLQLEHSRKVEGQVLDVAGLQPLAHEVGDEPITPTVGDQPLHLRAELGMQPAPVGEMEELVVGHRTPEDVRQP